MSDPTPEQIDELLAQIEARMPEITRLGPAAVKKVHDQVQKLRRAALRHRASTEFIEFVRWMWPELEAVDYLEGPHHRKLAAALQRVVDGTCKRLIVTLAPRHSKSAFVSKALPTMFMGRRPNAKIIQTSNVKALADGFGRVVRDAVTSPRFREVFPTVALDPSSTSAAFWKTRQGGEYFAVGTGGAVAGHGGDLIIIDDPHRDEDAILGQWRPEVFDHAYDWYRTGPRQRLQPGGAIVVCMTRWSKRDLVGQLIENDEDGEWEVVDFPAILTIDEVEKPLWPDMWSLDELQATRKAIGALRWNAQYMQQPASVETALIKPADWQAWSGPRGEVISPPSCDHIVMAWDTAFSAKTSANYSACTVFGITERPDPVSGKNKPAAVLLFSWRGKLEYPDLKRKAKELYLEWKPERFLVEARATGGPLIQDLRAAGISVTDINVARGAKDANNDKISRVVAISDMFRSGYVWYVPSPANHEVIDEFADFPAGANDDLVDSATHALTWLKKYILDYRIRQQDEEDDDDAAGVRRSLGRRLYNW